MGKGGGQSPEMLLPDKENRSDISRREKATSMPSGFLDSNHLEPKHGLQQQESQLGPQQPQPHSTLTVFGFVSPIHHTPSPAAGGMIPLSPLLLMPFTAHSNNENKGMSGIMPLTNYSFGNGQSNTPPRKFTFSAQSQKIVPHNSVHPPRGAPPATPLRQQLDYPYQERGIHHFGLVDGPRMPWIVPTLVVIHSLVLAITMYENDCPRTSPTPQKCVLRFLNRLSFQPLNENPLLGPSYKALLSMGALQSRLVTNAGQGWRLLTCIWLHAGLFHLLANMIGLLSIGLRLEKDFGWMRVATIYVTAGFGGSLLSALFMQNQISVGASGALMGLLGATVAEILINWSAYHHRSRSLAALLLAIAVNLSFGLMPHVDNFAHIGGMFAGLLLGFIFLMRPRFAWVNQMVHDVDEVTRSRMKHTHLQTVTWFVALGLFLICYGTAMLALFKGYGLDIRRTCKWCQYMSCVPSFLWQCHSA